MIKYCVLPNHSKVLIIAPHPDDEAIGCGGVICKHLDRKDNLSFLYITDGQKNESFTGERRIEASKLMKYMDIKDYAFLGLQDQNIVISSKTIKIVREKLQNIHLIYLPHYNDGHIDHLKTNLLVAEALKGIDRNIELLCYEIWSPLKTNMIINISPYMNEKKRLISFYESQLKGMDFIKLISNLNEYRAMTCIQVNKSYQEVVRRDSEFLIKKGRKLILPWVGVEAFHSFNKESYLHYIDIVLNKVDL